MDLSCYITLSQAVSISTRKLKNFFFPLFLLRSIWIRVNFLFFLLKEL